MRQYLEAMGNILENGIDRPNRTGVDTRALFGMQFRYDMADGFPIITTKKINFDMVKGELLWFISGSSDVNKLKEIMGSDSTIWDANAEAAYWKSRASFRGDLGRVYGVQWRNWRGVHYPVDQLKECIENIKAVKEDPTLSVARRLIVTAWNPAELQLMALPPCHMFFQFNIRGEYLDLQMYQRSCDMFLGVPFNISSYSLLLHMVAQVTELQPGEFIHTLGDAHIYHNHFDQVDTQLWRAPHPLPTLKLNSAINSIDDFTMEDIQLENYRHDSHIKADMAV
jgi:thymidylate synthase